MALCGDDHQKLLARISRIEGQVRGLKKMVEKDRDCVEVLKQVAAARGALRAVGMLVLEDHLKGCVGQAIAETGQADDLISQVVDVVGNFTK